MIMLMRMGGGGALFLANIIYNSGLRSNFGQIKVGFSATQPHSDMLFLTMFNIYMCMFILHVKYSVDLK